ncbi:hypothetical protein BpHYR1_045364 [Brachionus plicatilis]|uniref:Uncharacterized protein n=1 Tax=Brachionus plicatilis TaxID=10195 RepID=A0A3M7RKN5_BRAPC|nr:hypothetical protein BpHYR1_045364 [Brachionus plicatilis]
MFNGSIDGKNDLSMILVTCFSASTGEILVRVLSKALIEYGLPLEAHIATYVVLGLNDIKQYSLSDIFTRILINKCNQCIIIASNNTNFAAICPSKIGLDLIKYRFMSTSSEIFVVYICKTKRSLMTLLSSKIVIVGLYEQVHQPFNCPGSIEIYNYKH